MLLTAHKPTAKRKNGHTLCALGTKKWPQQRKVIMPHLRLIKKEILECTIHINTGGRFIKLYHFTVSPTSHLGLKAVEIHTSGILSLEVYDSSIKITLVHYMK